MERAAGHDPAAARPAQLLRRIRFWSALFILGPAISGITAFPLVHETAWLIRISAALGLPQHLPALHAWFTHVAFAVADTAARYPFMPYGTDWLAFGHLVIATAFLGLWRDPVRNRWLVDWGLIACAGVLPLALFAHPVRQIPWFWTLIDSSFGVFGCIPLLIVRRQIDRLEAARST